MRAPTVAAALVAACVLGSRSTPAQGFVLRPSTALTTKVAGHPRVSMQFESPSSTYEGKLDAKTALLSAIQAGVGKGYFTTSGEAAKDIKRAIADLETLGADSPVRFPADFATLDGRWKLLYSSNIFGVGRLSPLALDTVYQVIDTAGDSVKNIVYATLSPPLFEDTWGRFPVEAVASAARRLSATVSFKVDFSIDHSYEVTSQEYPAQLKITQREVKLINCERPEQRSLVLPAIAPLARVGAGKFDTTYMDGDLRVSRGTLGEIRVFQRTTETGPSGGDDMWDGAAVDF